MKYYLAHHGVQNQHWGVRHGPPYPLDSNASKQAKRKSASKSSYDKLYGDKKGSTRHDKKFESAKKKIKKVISDPRFKKGAKIALGIAAAAGAGAATLYFIGTSMGATTMREAVHLLTEKIETENILTENKLTEKILTENKLTEKILTEKIETENILVEDILVE